LGLVDFGRKLRKFRKFRKFFKSKKHFVAGVSFPELLRDEQGTFLVKARLRSLLKASAGAATILFLKNLRNLRNSRNLRQNSSFQIT